ncbi:protein I'm not dead yet [Trichonephila clavipes]|nr:protein I'm not dead yet [Trichonephila clavipes]
MKDHHDPIFVGRLLNLEALHTTLLLSIAYSANCGGTGTVTGTSPNMILKGFMEEHYPESSELTFASWMAYNVPGMLICVCVGWITLQVLYVPCWTSKAERDFSGLPMRRDEGHVVDPPLVFKKGGLGRWERRALDGENGRRALKEGVPILE